VTDLVPYEAPETFAFFDELVACQDALANIEILIYEAWEFDDRLTKDAARRFLQIAAVCEWTMPWVAQMREWAS
jgi:hypothetical protein